MIVVTLQQAEAIAELRHSLVRDRVVRLLQDGVREGSEAGEAVAKSISLYCKTQ